MKQEEEGSGAKRRKGAVVTRDSISSDAEGGMHHELDFDPSLSEYERKRQENMRRNAEILNSLGLLEVRCLIWCLYVFLDCSHFFAPGESKLC